MCFQSQPFGSLLSLLPNAPENNLALFFPPACWKWPNYCQEEECEAFPGAVRDVGALRRPLLFRQFGYSRAHSTQNSQQLESTAASLRLQNSPKYTHTHTHIRKYTHTSHLLSSQPCVCASHLGLCSFLLWAGNIFMLKPKIISFSHDENKTNFFNYISHVV